MKATHRFISPPSTDFSQCGKNNHSRSQLRLDPPDDFESHTFQREPINLPPIHVWFKELAQPAPPSPRPVQHQRRPSHSCHCQRLGQLTHPHSAPARYEPYSLRRPSPRKKSLNLTEFFDRRDAEPNSYNLHLGVKRIRSSLEPSANDQNKYSCSIDHGCRCSDCPSGRSTAFGDVATPRHCITEIVVPNSVKYHGCPCGRCPLPQSQYSDRAEKYLSAPELPSRRGSGKIDTSKHTSGNDHFQPPCKAWSQARSIQKVDFNGSSSDCTPVIYRPHWSGGKEDESVDGDESGSPLTFNDNPESNPVTEEWLKHCVDLGKEDPSLTNIFKCLYPRKKGPCTFERKKSTVKRHVLAVHLGERPHVCTFCPQDPHKGPKAFGQMQGLRIHINAMHKGVGPWEPFICSHCSKEFADASQRNKHYKTQHPAVKIKPRNKKGI